MDETFLFNTVRQMLDLPADSEFSLGSIDDGSFVVVETTAHGERRYHPGTYGPGWIQPNEAVDLNFAGMRAYDTLKNLVEKALEGPLDYDHAFVLNPRQHPDLFKPDYAGHSIYGWAHEPALRALHMLSDELESKGYTFVLLGDRPDNYMLGVGYR